MNKEISVVMSVYNGEQYLKEAIDSILTQTFTNFEFIIIDDGSTDKSKDIIKSYKDSRIILIEQGNTGLAIALNNAIKKSQTPLIARMDADDIAMPERLEVQFNFLCSNPDHILIGTNAKVIDMEGNYIYNSNLPLLWEEIEKKFPHSSFFHSSVMFRKDIFYKAGCYFEATSKLYSFEDSILWNRMKGFGKMANTAQQLIKYRLLPNAATAKSGKGTKTISCIFKEIVFENALSEKNKKLLLTVKGNYNKIERERTYYIHISKKLLFNNYQPSKARKNLLNAIKIKFYEPFPYILFLFSFLPESVIHFIYRLKKTDTISLINNK